MKVRLRILLPALPEAMGSREAETEFPGETVKDLVDHLVARYGQRARTALLDENGRLDPVVQVLLNGREWIPHDRLDRALEDGDEVMFALMLAGG
jgi:molybdopterin converting factor small subunit